MQAYGLDILQPDTRVDLHLHTTASDGTWPPEKLVQEAKKKGIGLMAVTDHDTIDNILPAKRLAVQANIAFISGVEVSATLDNNLFHILGYGIDIANEELQNFFCRNRAMLEKKDDDSIRMLIERGYALDFSEYKQYQNNPRRGGWKALNFLVDKGICRDARDFFDRLFLGVSQQFFTVFSEPQEVIKLLRNAGGIPVLAHPVNFFNKLSLLETLDLFTKIGIEGFECFHPDLSEGDSRICVKWCKENGKIITAGSDCHGEAITSRCLGKPEATLRQLNLGAILDKISV